MTYSDLFLSSYYVQVVSTAGLASLSEGADGASTTVHHVRIAGPITEASLLAAIYRSIAPTIDLNIYRPNWDTLLDTLWYEAMRQARPQVLFIYDGFPVASVEDIALLSKFTQVMLWAGTRIERTTPSQTARPVCTRTVICCDK